MSDGPVLTMGDATPYPAYEDLRPPKEAVELWKGVERRCKSPNLKYAMILNLNGYSQREASRAGGYDDPSTLRDGLLRYGLRHIANGTDRLVANHREIAVLTTEMQLEQLHSGEEPDTKLAIVGGISTDKVEKREQWSKHESEGADLMGALGSVAAQIIKAGGKVEARLTTGDGGEATLSIGQGEPEAIEGEVVDG